MRRPVRFLAVAATVGGLGAGGTLMSYAAWAPPIQTAEIKVIAARMPPGVTPSATLQDGRAVVSWRAQELRAGLRMRRYTVTAHSVDGKPRPDVAHTVDATGEITESASFTAAELSGGEWRWALTPRFASWVGAEGRLSRKVNVPAPMAAAAPAGAMMPAVPAPVAGPALPGAPASLEPADGPTPATPTSAGPTRATPTRATPTSAGATTPDHTPPVAESAPAPEDLPPPSTGLVKQVPAAPPASVPPGQ